MTSDIYQRRVFIGFVLLASVSVWSRPAFTEDRGTPRAVTVEEAVETALQHNPELKAREQDRDTAQGALLQTRGYPNPELDLAVETDRVFAGQGEGRRSIGIAQTIVTAGKRRQRQENARLGVGVVEQTIQDAKRRLIGEVEETFYGLLFTQERLKLAREQIDLADRLVALSEGRFREGFAPEMDVTLAQVEYHTRLQEVGGLEQELVADRAALNMLMGQAVDEPVDARGALFVPPAFVKDGLFQEDAFVRRPDLRALNLESERVAGEVALVRAERVPDLNIALDVTEEMTVFDALRFSDRARLLGVKLSIPIPLFDRKQGELLSAQSRLRRAESERAALRARIARDVRVATARIASAETRLEHFTNDVVPLAKSNLDLTRQAYEQGFAGILQLLEAQRRFSDTQLGDLTAQYEHRLAIAALERDVGARAAGPQSRSIEIEGERP
ncbi:MAG: TolC family protein [Nitrospirae bacterium]|nr:TolC family protein [Nitrospirota bacterium]